MRERLDLDELERANLGKVVRPEDWMAVLAYARELERRVELRSMLLREQTDRLGAANLRIIELESASQPGSGEADTDKQADAVFEGWFADPEEPWLTAKGPNGSYRLMKTAQVHIGFRAGYRRGYAAGLRAAPSAGNAEKS